MSEPGAPERSGLLEEAAAWFARMRGPEAEASRAEFERWLARGALHRAAYNRAAEVFAMGKLLADEEGEDSGVMPEGRHAHRRAFVAIAASVLLIVAAGLLVARPSWLVTPRAVQPAVAANPQMAELTAASASQSIRLADNSLVRLESGARIAVQYGKAERRLSLESGSARFYVAHEQRPFIVYAAGGYVVAHGTVFDVALSTNRRVTVHLIEGVVDVGTPAKSTNAVDAHVIHRLSAGEMVSFAASADQAPESTSSPGIAAASERSMQSPDQGAKDFDSISLADVAQLANRTSPRPIIFADPKIGELRISGEFRIDNTDLLAERIAGLFGLAIDRRDPRTIVLRSR